MVANNFQILPSVCSNNKACRQFLFMEIHILAIPTDVNILYIHIQFYEVRPSFDTLQIPVDINVSIH